MNRIDLKDNEYKVFDDSELVLDCNNTIIFGKNGSGKSTISKLIEKQFMNTHDVQIFNNEYFNNVISTDDGLDSIRLGKKNNEIEKEIKDIKKEISEKKEAAESFDKNKKEKLREKGTKENEIEKFCTESAKDVKQFCEITDKYDKSEQLKKLLNVNSHSIDDLSADLNGKNRDDIITLFKQLFVTNNAENHFKEHWKIQNT